MITGSKKLVKDTKPLDTLDIAPLLYSLAILIKAKATAEIGVFGGYVTVALAKAMRKNKGKHYGIEVNPIYAKQTKDVIKRYKLARYYKEVIGDSARVGFNEKLDLLFIDGDHSENQINREIKKYFPLINKDGFMCFHDTEQREVKSALEGSARAIERDNSQVINIPFSKGITIWKKV